MNATLNSVVTFQCNGIGILLSWIVDNLGIDDLELQRRGIASIASRDTQAGTTNLTLTVPATRENNNSVIGCLAIGNPNDQANATLKVQGKRSHGYSI